MITMLESMDTDQTAKLVSNYKKGNILEIYDAITDEKVMNEKSKKRMIDNRNIDWVKQLPELMQEKSIFVAVGAAHLAGNNGLINLLREAGYIVKPIIK